MYIAAARTGHTEAEHEAGRCYADGIGIAQNVEKAAELFARAAEKGYAISQYYLGYYYENGYGVPKDIGKAKELYQKAADNGNTDAAQRLEMLRN